jgi:pimeloyl-ACP methyl ester carboxylesterase
MVRTAPRPAVANVAAPSVRTATDGMIAAMTSARARHRRTAARRTAERRILRRSAGALLAIVLLSSCSTLAGTPERGGSPSADQAGTTAPPDNQITAPTTARSTGVPGPVPAGLQRYYTQQLQWGDCESYATTADDQQAYRTPGISCARLTLPMDYAKPDGQTITIGVLRKPATGQSQGSVLFNPGGPGASGMSIVATIAEYDVDPTLNASFDLVGFDPRGVGASEPAIACQTDEQRDADRAKNWPGLLPTSPPREVRAANDASTAFAAACVRTISQRGVDGKAFLAQVGTTNVAKDMDVLRAVLGDRRLTYVGWSYGTSIGTQYAEQFPHNVRAMILDGAINPAIDSATDNLDQTRAFQQAFDAFAAWCAPRQGCPWTSADRADRRFQQLAQPLMTTPMPLPDGRAMSFLDAVTGVSDALYSDSAWPTLLTALHHLTQGDGAALMSLADDYNGRDASGHYSGLLEAFTAIRCMDTNRVTDADTVTRLNRELLKVAPFEDNGQPAAAVFDTCAFWPVPPTMTPHTPDPKGLAKVLVISTTGDPATPYQDGVDLAKDLGGALLTVKGTRHTAFMLSGITCADRIGNDYLINLTVPPDGASCS